VLGMCIGGGSCQNECSMSFSTTCIRGAANVCAPSQFCCDVPYQVPGDCFDFSDPIMGAIAY
jgi:hypothetical protein